MAEPLRLTTAKRADNEAREPFFYIDDEEFTLPVEVSPVVGIQYLRDVRAAGPEVAVSRAFHRLIGQRGIDQLAKVETLTKEQLATIMTIIQTKIAGTLEEASGN